MIIDELICQHGRHELRKKKKKKKDNVIEKELEKVKPGGKLPCSAVAMRCVGKLVEGFVNKAKTK